MLLLLLFVVVVVVVVVIVVIIVVVFLFSFSIVLCRHFMIIRLFIALGLLHFRFAGVWIQRLRRYAFNSKRLFFSRFYLFPQRIFSGRGDSFDRRHHARTSRWNRGGNVLRPRGKFCGEDNGTYVFASRWKRRRLSIFHLRLIRRRSEDFSSTFFFFFFFFFYFYF